MAVTTPKGEIYRMQQGAGKIPKKGISAPTGIGGALRRTLSGDNVKPSTEFDDYTYSGPINTTTTAVAISTIDIFSSKK